MEQIYDTIPCSTLRVSLETEGNGQSHPFAPWSKCKKRSRREHLRLRQFVKEYSPKSLRNREGFWYNRRKPPREAPSWKSTPKPPAAKQWLLT